jgi:YbbR domain-containing protein
MSISAIADFFRGLFTRNILLKVVSLIIAFLLWGFLMLEKKSEVALSIPVRVENIPQGTVVTSPPPSDVRVVVRGRRTQLSAMSDRILPYVIDLTGARAGVNTFEVIAAKILLPRGLQIVHISPAQFDIHLSKVTDKRLPVAVRFRGALPAGYKLTSYNVQPEIIAISAAREELAELKSLETEPIDLSPLRGDIELSVDLSLRDLHILDITTHSVDVRLNIEEREVERSFKNLPVTFPEGRSARGQSTVSVTVRGPAGIMENLEAGDLKAFAEAVRRGRGSRAAIRVEAPENVNVIRVTPTTLEVSP